MRAAEALGHRLDPGQRVDAAPRLDILDGQVQAHHRVLVGHLPGGLPLEVGVDPLGVGLVEAAGLVGQELPLLLGNTAPAHGADRDVGLLARFADQLGEPPSGQVASHVHLEEPVLGLDVSLSEEQIAVGGGVDVGDALAVTTHGDLIGGAGQCDRAVILRQRSPQDDGERHPGDECEHDEPAHRCDEPFPDSVSASAWGRRSLSG